MSNTDAWQDFEQVRHGIKNNTVDKLKQILANLNSECGTHLSRTGKKQDLIDRIVEILDQWRKTVDEERWTKARTIIYQIRNTGVYTPSNRVTSAIASTSHGVYDPPKPNAYTQTVASGVGHYDPYAPPRRPATVAAPVASSSSVKALPIRFGESPFFSVDQAVSSITECPESTSATDRRVASMTFTLNNDQLNKVKEPGSKYQLRLYCTSSIFYAGFSTFRTNPIPCPIEFPPTCEVRINTTAVQANLKGLKKKPGTAPPPDITSLARLSGSNKVDMVYVNSQQPLQSKKYYMIIMLVEATTTDALVTKVKEQNYRSAEDVRQKMRQIMNEDDDIIAGPQKMSLGCPLTFMRIVTPCRSEKCVHPQCFDAKSWFTMMEQTTTWLCPVCERILDHKDLIIDGYFDDILKQTPDTVEDVMVEADGEWHTSDNKHASAQWKAAHPYQNPSITMKSSFRIPAPVQERNESEHGSSPANGKGKAPDVEILILDSDEDEDEGIVKRELSPSHDTSSRASFDTVPRKQTQSQSSSNIIDLTLEDSDDEQPPVYNNFGKRKASDANLAESLPDQLWKKGRIDSSRILPAPLPSAPITGLRTAINNHPPSPPGLRYPGLSSFRDNTLPPPAYPSFNRNGSGNSSLQLPPISNSFIPRQSSSSHNPSWS